MPRTGDADRCVDLPRCRAGRFPPAADRVPNGFVGLPFRPGRGDRRHEDRVVEPRPHAVDDVVVEGLVRLQLVTDRTELRLRFVRIFRARFRAVRGGFLTEAAGGDDLGQPDAVALGGVLGNALLAPFLARVLGKDVEAADGLVGGRIVRRGIGVRYGGLLSLLEASAQFGACTLRAAIARRAAWIVTAGCACCR
jgi:hypothetical protein